ncbi:DUF4870 domain-containing protein [Propioniciclava soli]|uniref:DUF4870 domain-containing protein n=1 Tax=Propioniciclava soli TaxID=2775081 RepID=A0ABZ3CB00_9ACTN
MTQSQPHPHDPQSPDPEHGQQRRPSAQTAWQNPADAPPPFPQPQYTQPQSTQPPFAAGHPGNLYAGRPLAGRQPIDAQERTWAVVAHLSSVIAWAVSAGWLSFVGPLVIYLLQKDRSRFVRNASSGAFNFAVSMAIVSILGWILTFTFVGAVIGIPMIVVGGLGSLVLGIIGALRAAKDEPYTYPLQIRILS